MCEDTSPEASAHLLELLRRATPGEKLARVFELTQIAIELSRAGVRAQYPEADEREVRLRAAARVYDRETMIRAFGWDPAEHR
jgi:hypothetical protein